MEGLSEEERRALRGSKFAPLPSSYSSSSSSTASSSRSQQPRLAHPGGPMKTNKAAALAKFLERKLQEPDGLSSINPDLIELAVKNAKRTVLLSSSGNSNPETVIRHVTSFGDPEDSFEDFKEECSQKMGKKKKKKKGMKNKMLKIVDDGEGAKVKRPKKKLL